MAIIRFPGGGRRGLNPGGQTDADRMPWRPNEAAIAEMRSGAKAGVRKQGPFKLPRSRRADLQRFPLTGPLIIVWQTSDSSRCRDFTIQQQPRPQ